MEEKILYISDLDGTLLNNEVKLSDFTIKAINSLMDKGMIFSFATARSQYTGTKVSRGIVPKVPIIIYNGTFIYDVASGKRIVSNSYSKEEAKEILDSLLENNIYPMVHAFSGEQETEEGCLSIPGRWGVTRRPMHVTVRAMNRKGETVDYTGSGLLAKAFCYELDHLDGKLYTDCAIRMNSK